MQPKEIHMRFRDIASVSLLFAALERSYPHFRPNYGDVVVEGGGKEGQEDVFRILREISTSFPHRGVERNVQ